MFTGDQIVTILLAIFSIIGTIATAVAIPLINQMIQERKLKSARLWVTAAVKAAEKLFADPEEGANKKKFVLDFLEGQGIILTESQLTVLIEAAVQELRISANEIKDYQVSTINVPAADLSEVSAQKFF